jgi:hypothetical protein
MDKIFFFLGKVWNILQLNLMRKLCWFCLAMLEHYRHESKESLRIEWNRHIKVTQRNLKMWPLWAVALYVQLNNMKLPFIYIYSDLLHRGAILTVTLLPIKLKMHMSVKLNLKFILVVHDANNVVIFGRNYEFTHGFQWGSCYSILVLYVCLVDRCLSFCTFSFGHCNVDIWILITPLVSSNSSHLCSLN